MTGLSGVVYNSATTTITGIYQYASPVTVTLDWAGSGSVPTGPGGNNGGGGEVTTVSLTVSGPSGLKVEQGQTADWSLAITWTGTNDLTITAVQFRSLAGWMTLSASLPKSVSKAIGSEAGNASIPVRILVPSDAAIGSYNVEVQVDASAMGGTVSSNCYLSFVVAQPTHPAGPISDWMTYVFVVAILCFVVYAYVVRKK